MTTNLNNLLHGTELMRDSADHLIIQSIRNMDLVFLTCDAQFSQDARFANPLTAIRASNHQYGHLRLANTDPQKDVIVMPQIAVMTPYKAQDHALPKAAALPRGRAKDFNDAGCVEGSQPGHIRGEGSEVLRFMPTSIREMLYGEVGHTGSYSHLYASVTSLGERTKTDAGAYLKTYFTKTDATTTEFIAHFERPRKMIGVIVLIDNEIVAIDRFPSYTYGAQVWDLLVRDCYGALAIESQLKGAGAHTDFPETLRAMDKRYGSSNIVDQLAEALDEMDRQREARVRSRLAEILELSLQEQNDPNGDEVFKSIILGAEGYIGQAILAEGFPVSVSLVKRDKFNPNKMRKSREVVDTYRRLNQEARAFSL